MTDDQQLIDEMRRQLDAPIEIIVIDDGAWSKPHSATIKVLNPDTFIDATHFEGTEQAPNNPFIGVGFDLGCRGGLILSPHNAQRLIASLQAALAGK